MSMTQEEIDALINSGGISLEETATTDHGQVVSMGEPSYTDLGYDSTKEGNTQTADPKLELLYDLQLPVSIELGRTNMLIRNILRLGRGSVIEFDKLVSEPVDVLINGKKVAEGEVVVIDKHFGIRITTLVDPSDRLRSIKKA
jgi:flagellar motor switch protein FliN